MKTQLKYKHSFAAFISSRIKYAVVSEGQGEDACLDFTVINTDLNTLR